MATLVDGMNETEIIAQLNFLKDGIYLYNWIVERSDLGLQWVRLRHYSCIPFPGEKERCQDFDAQEMWDAFNSNQGVDSPEDYLANLDKYVKTAGPAYWLDQK